MAEPAEDSRTYLQKDIMLRTKQIVFALAGSGLLTTGVQATTYTQVNQPPGNELSRAELFSQFFFDDFVQNGKDFTNAFIDITRVSDDADQSYHLNAWTADVLSTWSSAS